MFKRHLFFSLIALFCAIQLNATIYYVHPDGNDVNDGESWSDAFATLQAALEEASDGDEIWVAAGTYYPTHDYGLGLGDRGQHFQMVPGVAIYGGFPTTGDPTMDDRDWETNETILSGDIGTPGDSTDNCYHVFYHPDGLGLDDSAILDGFTITAGNADDADMPHRLGGGMYNFNNSPFIQNCTFTENYAAGGGGMYNTNSSNPTINQCIFSYNIAVDGGGMFIVLSSEPLITDCQFIYNETIGGSGGGINNQSNSTIINCIIEYNTALNAGGGIRNSSNSTIINCTISNNSASSNGGGMVNFGASPTIINCTISNNTSSANGGGMYSTFNPSPEINNSIIWGNTASNEGHQFYIFDGETTLNYSCYSNEDNDIEGSGTFTATNNNITDDPMFVGIGEHPYSIVGNSPCVDAGDDDLVPVEITTDIFGNPRIVGNSVDMGAYEYANIYFVKTDGDDNNSGYSWSEAFATLQKALDEAGEGYQIWVAAGTYYPTHYYDLADDNERLFHFRMINGVSIYGGFPTTGNPTMDDRDWETNETILSGDIGVPDNNSDNCYHVFYHPSGLGLDDTAILDGFTIRYGNANGSDPHNQGGGMYNLENSPTIINCKYRYNIAIYGGGMYNNNSSPTLTDITISNNSSSGGGGMYNNNSHPTISYCTFSENSTTDLTGGGMYNSNSHPTISYCTFTDNSAYAAGGGISNQESNPTISNCSFSYNYTSDGGGMYNNNSNPTISNCSFSYNQATFGGGIYNNNSSPLINNCIFSYNTVNLGGGIFNINSSSPIISNCTISNNSATDGGGLYNFDGNPTINNSIIWGNIAEEEGHQFYLESGIITLNYSCYSNEDNDLEGAGAFLTSNGNITDDPLFVGTGEHPFMLSGSSPCINAGDDDLVPIDITTDILGNPRIVSTVDMGAYEFPFSITGLIAHFDDECIDNEVVLSGEIEVEGGSGDFTYSWSPSYLVEHPNPSEPYAILLRVIRDMKYTLTITDNETETSTSIQINVTAVPKVNIQSKIVHRYKHNEFPAPLNLLTLIDEPTDFTGLTVYWEDRFSGEEFEDAASYSPEPNSSLYLWLILYDEETECEVGRRRMNIIVR